MRGLKPALLVAYLVAITQAQPAGGLLSYLAQGAPLAPRNTRLE